MTFNEFKYERIAYEELEAVYGKLLNELKEVTNSIEFMRVFGEINAFRNHVMTMTTLCSIRHTINTADKFYEEENDYWDETMPKLQALETRFFKICLDYPNRIELDIPDTFFKLAEYSFKAFDEKIIADLQEENRLTSEYGKLKASARIEFDGEIYNLASISSKFKDPDRNVRKRAYLAYCHFFEENEEKFDELYDKLVKLRDNMAKKLGYKNFIELGYLRMNRFDYDEKMVANYRKQVLDEIVPIARRIYKKQAERIDVDKLEIYDVDYQFKDGNPTPIGDEEALVKAALQMYSEMSKTTGEFFKMMTDQQLFDLSTKPNKEMGGYCTELFDYKAPFIFSNFNGTEGDVNVLTHEAGHALQCFMSLKKIDIPDICFPTMESCEIHSMSMEFFAFPWLKLFFGDDATKYEYTELAGALTFLPYGCLIDHFQHEVYAHPEMTAKQRKDTWRALEKQYKPDISYDDFPVLERGGYFYRQGHIFESPFYYIDYTLAQVCALQFYKRILDKDDDAFADYLRICEVGGTMSFVALVKEAGLISPFADGCLKNISGIMEQELERIEEVI